MRTLLVLVATVTVLAAVVLTAGRLFVAFLPTLEPDINAALKANDVDLTGLSARWHLLNPVIEIDEVRFAGGRAHQIEAELDLLESLWDFDPVVRVARAQSLELVAVHLPDGRWSIGNRPGAPAGEFRIGAWLRESDLLDLPDVKVTLLDQTADEATVLGEYTLSASLANLGSRHRGRVVARTTGDTCTTCELVAHWDLVEQTLGSAIISGELSARGRAIEIPQALGAALHAAGFAINKLDVAWHIAEGRGIGRAAVDLRGITFPSGTVDAVRADVAIGSTAGSAVWGRMDTFTVESGSQQLSLAGTSFAADLPRSLIDFVVAPIDAAVLAQLVRAGGANVEALTRWIDALNPHGRIDGVVARLDYSARTAAAVARLEDGAIDHYKGVPTVRGGRATIAAFEHGAELDLVPGPATVGMLDLFGEVSELESLSGRVFMWMGSGYLGVKSMDLDAKLGPSQIGGSFAIARPDDPEEQRVSANVGLRDMDAAVAKRYVPIKLPEGVVRFLEQGIVGGHLDELALAYHGHTRAIEDLPMRRLEMHVTMHDGAIRYHPDWPIASGLVGDLDVTFDRTSGRIVSGQMLGLALDSGSFNYAKGRDFIEVHGTAHADATQALEFFRASPLAKWMPQVDPSWTAKGPVSFAAALNVPMREGGTPLAVALDSTLDGVDLDMVNWRLPIGGLRGDVHYTHPFVVSASGVTGTLFDRPTTFGAANANDAVHLTANGSATVDALASWLKLPPLVFSGELAYQSDLAIPVGEKRSVELTADSDLVGVAIQLPAELGKTPEERRAARLHVRFDDALMALDVATDGVSGWAHVVDGAVARGALGVNVVPENENSDRSGVLVTGRLSELDAARWVGAANSSSGTAHLPKFDVEDFTIDRAFVRDVELHDLKATANGDAEGLSMSVVGPSIDGTYESARGAVPKLTIRKLLLPGGEGKGDPLADVDPLVVPDIDAEISGVMTGNVERGRWKVSLRQQPDGLAFTNVTGDLNELHIASDTGGKWTQQGRSSFAGALSAGDVSKVLVGYGYAPSVETKSVSGRVDLEWPGSPLNFGLAHLSGKVSFKAEDGRFVDVGASASGTRIFSLLNFTAIAKRMTLDFSDVFGKGVSFEEMSAKAAVDDGTLKFIEPLEVAGTGSNFRVSGTVDLDRGGLDNEMIVTLPVSASLPWYAAYLGFFANPLAAGAVIVGERIFRNQIEQFSSAKYRIEGTLDDPKVSFVRVFTNSMEDEADESHTQANPEATDKGA